MRRPNQLPFILSAVAFLFALGVIACSGGGEIEGAEMSRKTSVHLAVARATVSLADSTVLDLTGPDTIHEVLKDDSNSLNLRLDPGTWNFSAKFYANGILVQQGESSAQLSAGTDTSLSIAMHAVAGFLYVKIPLGLENPKGIGEGTLRVQNGKDAKSYAVEIKNGEASATTGKLSLGVDYQVDLVLLSSTADTLFVFHSTVTLDDSRFVADWTLKSVNAAVSLLVVTDSVDTLKASAHLPSRRKSPQKGELFVTELMTEGKQEFIEYYNGSLDTLDLSGCTLKTAVSGGFKVAADSSVLLKKTIAPLSYFVFGSDSVEDRDALADFSMPGTKGSVALSCGSVLVDSLFYVFEKNLADSLGIGAFPKSDTKSAQLPLANYKNRNSGAFWCTDAFSRHSETTCLPKPDAVSSSSSTN